MRIKEGKSASRKKAWLAFVDACRACSYKTRVPLSDGLDPGAPDYLAEAYTVPRYLFGMFPISKESIVSAVVSDYGDHIEVSLECPVEKRGAGTVFARAFEQAWGQEVEFVLC